MDEFRGREEKEGNKFKNAKDDGCVGEMGACSANPYKYQTHGMDLLQDMKVRGKEAGRWRVSANPWELSLITNKPIGRPIT